MPSNLCKYTKECPIYKGIEETNETALPVYKNVFCKRGSKGWNNCKKYIEYESANN